KGTAMSCRGWRQEGALRMLMNSVDQEFSDRAGALKVIGGTQKPLKDEAAFQVILSALKDLRVDETLVVRSGELAEVQATSESAPRVVIVNSHRPGGHAEWNQFSADDRSGLCLFDEMTSGSWIHTGAQGILQATYEVFAAAAAKHFGGDLSGKFVAS